MSVLTKMTGIIISATSEQPYFFMITLNNVSDEPTQN